MASPIARTETVPVSAAAIEELCAFVGIITTGEILKLDAILDTAEGLAGS